MDGAFCKVGAMAVCVGELVCKVLLFNAGDEFFGDFIVESLEHGLDASLFEDVVACFISDDEVFLGSALDGMG